MSTKRVIQNITGLFSGAFLGIGLERNSIGLIFAGLIGFVVISVLLEVSEGKR